MVARHSRQSRAPDIHPSAAHDILLDTGCRIAVPAEETRHQPQWRRPAPSNTSTGKPIRACPPVPHPQWCMWELNPRYPGQGHTRMDVCHPAG
jgi:hypothetical protein